MKSALNVHWKDCCWSWNSNTLVTWCEELTHLKRPQCWERLKVGGKRDDRGWDGWMSSLTQWTWVWINSRSWWWTGKPDVLQSMGSQRVGHDWVTELNWSKENEQSVLKIREIPSDFQGRVFKGNISGMGCRVPDKTGSFFWLVAGWGRYLDQHHQPCGTNQSEVYVLVVNSFLVLEFGVCKNNLGGTFLGSMV